MLKTDFSYLKMGEMGWITPTIRRKINMLRYWNNIMQMNPSCLPKIIYNKLKSGNEPWYKELENLFISITALNVLTSNVGVVNYKVNYRLC